MGRQEETAIQITLVQWFKMAYPGRLISSSSHAGLKMDGRSGALAKKLGYHAGWPDLTIPYPRGGFHGMYLELKTHEGKVSEHQEETLRLLRGIGYNAIVARGFDEAVRAVNRYMLLPIYGIDYNDEIKEI